jgi:hypothetical protein
VPTLGKFVQRVLNIATYTSASQRPKEARYPLQILELLVWLWGLLRSPRGLSRTIGPESPLPPPPPPGAGGPLGRGEGGAGAGEAFRTPRR